MILTEVVYLQSVSEKFKKILIVIACAIGGKMVEIWKDIKGYEGLYQVSNLGRVKSLKEL